MHVPKINLSPDEEELFTLLKQVASVHAPSATLRFAGGWVRDAILATPEFSITINNVNHNSNKKHNLLNEKAMIMC